MVWSFQKCWNQQQQCLSPSIISFSCLFQLDVTEMELVFIFDWTKGDSERHHSAMKLLMKTLVLPKVPPVKGSQLQATMAQVPASTKHQETIL